MNSRIENSEIDRRVADPESRLLCTWAPCHSWGLQEGTQVDMISIGLLCGDCDRSKCGFDEKAQLWKAKDLDASHLMDGEYLQVHY